MILKPSIENIKKAAEELKLGNVVAFPTETVYGLGADCTNPLAVLKIFEVKKRPSFNPLIVHIHKQSLLNDIAYIENPNIIKIIEKFWPGPLTIVLPKKEIIPDIVTSGHSTVAVRMPAHHVALKLIEECGVPVCAPSANEFGFLSPTKAEHVEKHLGDKINIILDGGASDVGLESTIIEFLKDEIKILRPGGLPVELIKKIVPSVKFENLPGGSPRAPGMLLHHYAPAKKINFIDQVDLNKIDLTQAGALLYNGKNHKDDFRTKRILTVNNNMREAAANLFKYLHELENENVDLILCEKVEMEGLGIAIMDRLTKAVNRYK